MIISRTWKNARKLHLVPTDLRVHTRSNRALRARSCPRDLRVETTREVLDQRLDRLPTVEEGQKALGSAVTEGLRANLMRRLDRFERRLIAGAKKEHGELMSEIGTARARCFLSASTRNAPSTSFRSWRVMVPLCATRCSGKRSVTRPD
jgi:hypothetical protein